MQSSLADRTRAVISALRTRSTRALPAIAGVLRTRHWDVLGVALALIYALPSIWYPFGSDQAIHWYLGHALLHGELPYVSGISGKPPGIFVVHAFAELLFGNSQRAIRLLELFALPFFGYFITRCLRSSADDTLPDALSDNLAGTPKRVIDGELGAATLLLSAANFTYHDYWDTAHPETWMGFCLTAALAIALNDTRSMRRALSCGALCMAAFALKYTGAAVALPISLVCGVRAMLVPGAPTTPVRRLRALALETAWFVAGMLLVLAACVLPYVISGHLREMREVCIDMTERYVAGSGAARAWLPTLSALRWQGTLSYTALGIWLAGCAIALRKRRYRALVVGVLLVPMFCAAVFSVVMQGRLFYYHWVVVLPFCVAILAWGLRQLLAPRGYFELLFALAFTLAVFFYQPHFIAHSPHSYREHVSHVIAMLRGDPNWTSDRLTLSYERQGGSDRYAYMLHAGRFIRAHSKPGDTMCLSRFVSPIYEVAGLRCTTRHAIGLFVSFGPRSWAKEYAHDLKTKPPTFMVTLDWLGSDIRVIEKRHYHELRRFGTIVVLVKNDAKR